MLCAFNKVPRGFQSIVIPHILCMITVNIPAQSILMVQQTGAGKSSVPLAVAVSDGRTTIILKNTIALGSDHMYQAQVCSYFL